MAIDPNKTYTAIIETAKGTVTAELFAKDAPKTVNNFVFLARQGFYDGLTFHRVLPGFVAQGGDPQGNGTGGPGYTFEDEPSTRTHEEGVFSMANSGPNTNGSQFFVTLAPQPQLDGSYTVFGKVVEGLEVVKQLTPRNPDTAPAYQGDAITRITIREN
ncbi:MAG: peptidylprolyl isomerase [Chloroflexi bacterium]|nr:peptidylprolyl isomerase [Chloroflexota bacterium]